MSADPESTPAAQSPEPAESAAAHGEVERLRAALRESEARYQRLARSLPQFIWESDASGQVRYVNQRWVDYSGLSPVETRDPRKVFDTFHPDDAPRIASAWTQAQAALEAMEVEGRLRRRDGAYCWFLMRTEPVFEDGRLIGWFGTSTDVTELKRAESRIRELADDLRVQLDEQQTLLRALPVGVFIAQDPACTQITMNPVGAAMLRLPIDANASMTGPQAAGLPFRVLRNGVEVPGEELPMQVASRTGLTVMGMEVDVEFENGESISLLEHARPLYDEHGRIRGCVGVFVDITEREQAERALRDSEQRFQLVARTTNDAIWDWDLISDQVWWNEGVQQLSGFGPGQASASSTWWDEHLHPGDRDRVLAGVEAVIHGGGTSWRDEYRFCRADGSSAFVLDRGYVIRDENGRALRMVGAMHDLTERKRAEDALKESGRRKDEFLATLAHELRNPLAALAAAAQLLAKANQKPVIADVAREALQRQVEHMARLLDDLLDVSRITHGMVQLQLETLDVMQAAHAAAETARPQIEARRHGFRVHAPPGPVYVRADRIRLTQIIWNLLSNSAKYTDAGGEIDLMIRTQDEAAVISVRDNGIGIAPEMIGKVFEMFSQATPALQRSDGGLGIGLSLVRGLVRLHGGAIEAHSAGVGQGSEFTVRLPLASAPDGAASPASEAASHQVQGLRILIADDNVDGAQSWAMLLELAGHDVRVVHDGGRALEAAEHFKPQLALLDIGMPVMNGYEVARAIRATSWGADAVLVAVTGWGQTQDKLQAHEAGFDHHFTKPVGMSELEPILASIASRE